MVNFSSETMQVRRRWSDIFRLPGKKKNSYSPQNSLSRKTILQTEQERNNGELTVSRLALKEKSKKILQAEEIWQGYVSTTFKEFLKL